MEKGHASTLVRWGLVGSLIAIAGLEVLPERTQPGLATQVVARPVLATPESRLNSHDDAVASFLSTRSSGTVLLEEATGEVKRFTLEIHKIDAEIAPDVVVEQWAFALPGEAPSVPGPELRVTEGDLVRITMKNTHDQPHSLHLHGITSLAQGMDGVPHTSLQVLPGEAYTYEFVATEPGTHAYHCHVQTYLHMDMGMYGALIVEPREAEGVTDRDYTLILDEWDSEQDPLAAVHAPENNYFLINGKAFPWVEPLEIPEGEVARVRMINMGYEPHAMHLHGLNFLVVAKDGYDLSQPYRADTLPIFPGERFDLLVKGRDGDFPFHDHIVKSVTNGGVYPGGMHTMVTGSEAHVANPNAVVTKLASTSPAPVAPPSSGHVNHMRHDHAGHDHTAHAQAPAASTSSNAALQEGEVTVRITQFAFDTPVLRVKRGTTVTWVNDDVAPHTVTEGTPGADPATRAFDSSEEARGTPKMMNQGDTWSTTFSEPGEHTYYCLPHPFMTAKVIVE